MTPSVPASFWANVVNNDKNPVQTGKHNSGDTHFVRFVVKVRSERKNAEGKWTYAYVTCFRTVGQESAAQALSSYLKDGQAVFLQGRVAANAYTNKEGKAIGAFQMNVNNFEFVANYAESQGQSSAVPQAQTTSRTGTTNADGNTELDELPF